jgi:hypothetical protein
MESIFKTWSAINKKQLRRLIDKIGFWENVESWVNKYSNPLNHFYSISFIEFKNEGCKIDEI